MHKYHKYKYKGITPFLDGTGITECFTTDILKIDKKENKC